MTNEKNQKTKEEILTSEGEKIWNDNKEEIEEKSFGYPGRASQSIYDIRTGKEYDVPSITPDDLPEMVEGLYQEFKEKYPEENSMDVEDFSVELGYENFVDYIWKESPNLREIIHDEFVNLYLQNEELEGD